MTVTKDKPRTRRWKRWALVLGILFIIGSVTSVEITSQPFFCGTCHIMESYYDSWAEDVHHEVPCTACHIAPGAQNLVAAKLNGLGQVVDDWLNRTSTKPSASISDMSCGREGCHDVEDLKKKETKTDKFIFKHGKHLGRTYEGIAIHCSTCHSHVRGENHFQVNTNVCVTCHLIVNTNGLIAHIPAAPTDHDAPQAETVVQPASLSSGQAPASRTPTDTGDGTIRPPKDCRKCHIPPQEPFEYQGLVVDHTEYLSFGASCESCHHGVTAPPQIIDDDKCLSCHIFGVEKVEDMESVHKTHTEGEHKVECFNCHGVTRHGPEAQSMSLNRVDCYACHSGQHAVQKATYLQNGPLEDLSSLDATAISPMFLVHVDCTGCHIEPSPLKLNPASGATVARAVPAACDNCHQEGLGAQMIPLWQDSTHKIYDEVQNLLPTVDNPWDETCPEAKDKLDEANRLLELVRLDGSWGVHNPRYTEQLIEQARQAALKAIEQCRRAHDGKP